MKSNAPYPILAAAVLLGLLSDLLFHDSIATMAPVGLSVPVWNLIFAGFLVLLSRQLKQNENLPRGLWFLLPSILFSCGLAFRDSNTLKGLDLFAMAMCTSLASASLQGVRVALSGFTTYIASLAVFVLNLLVAGLVYFLDDLFSGQPLPQKYRKYTLTAVRGVALSIPFVAIFGGLLMSADGKFERIISRAFQLDYITALGHIALFSACTWLASGYLKVTFNQPIISLTALDDDGQGEERRSWRFIKLGVAESGITLGLLNILFLVFTIVQIPYFFGTATSAACAEYARRGFFELTTVVSLVLPMLLAMDWMVRRESKTQQLIFKSLVGFQIALMGVITASAMHKMHLYRHEYGLTELRVYTTAFMGWLATVLVIFCMTVLKGKRQNFAFASFIAGLVFIGGLHLADPDALIVRTNIARAQEGKPFDVMYVLSLSNDAVEPLLKELKKLDDEDQRKVAEALLSGYARSWRVDWRSWNWSRCAAARAVHKRLARLKNSVHIARQPDMSCALASR